MLEIIRSGLRSYSLGNVNRHLLYTDAFQIFPKILYLLEVFMYDFSISSKYINTVLVQEVYQNTLFTPSKETKTKFAYITFILMSQLVTFKRALRTPVLPNSAALCRGVKPTHKNKNKRTINSSLH